MASFLFKIVLPSFLICCCSFIIFISGCGDVTGDLASLSISPVKVTVGVNKSQVFTVVGHDGVGMIIEVSPTWSVTGGIGTISSDGLFSAGSAAGSGTVVASYESMSATASVTITDKGWIIGRVLDSKGTIVPSMKVYLKNTALLDFTDSSGYYSISNVPPGSYEAWTMQTEVYRPASQEVEVAAGGTDTANFTILYFSDPPDLSIPDFEF
ncbi:MAG: carboxypeptidase-like regulatory domain-containing protein [Candidatus Margulisbacteria bacterium]|nr:carboxypeptidase-like regulatory domain-containing protein [Candidatus Margulisiibacteriota bacterium]